MITRPKLVASALATVLALATACGDDIHVSAPANHAPELRDIPDTSVALGSTLDVFFHATDRDGDSLAFVLTNILSFEEVRQGYRPDSALDEDLRQFTFTPAERDAPSRSFRITVRDAGGDADSTQFTVAIE